MKDLTMKEYKQKKDEFKINLMELINKFNNDTGLIIEDLNISINNARNIRGDAKFYDAEIDITTNLDK